MKLMTCANCSCVAYHNSNCQRSHWRTHKRECKELACAMLPLKELVRWRTIHEKSKKGAGGEKFSVVASGRRVWCWWTPDNENGITEDTLSISNNIWGENAQRWRNREYLVAMEGFQHSLEPYNKAWSNIGETNGANEMRGDDMENFLSRSLILAKRLLFCAFCEMDGSQVQSARQRLVQCISITMAVFFTYPSMSSRELIRSIMNDAWMEMMLR
jgi:hypothetical protein